MQKLQWRWIWILVFLWLVAVGLQAPSCFGYFAADDFLLVRRASGQDLVEFFLRGDFGVGQGGFYRPLVRLFLAGQYFLWGHWSGGYHVVNVLLHLVVCGLVYGFGRTLLKAEGECLLAAVVFAAHPVHVEAVSWISGSHDLLCTLFCLASWGLFGCCLRLPQRQGMYVLSVTFFTSALLCKEMAVTLPVMLVLTARWLGPRPMNWRNSLRFVFPFFVVLGTYLGLRWFLLGGWGGYPHVPHRPTPPTGGAFTMLTFISHITGLAIPYRVWRDAPSFSMAHFLVALFLLSGLLIVLLKGDRQVRFSVLWILVTLLPAAAVRGDRILYLPSVGFCWLLALGFWKAILWLEARVECRWGRALRVSLPLAGAVLLASYGWETVHLATEWRKVGQIARAVPAQMRQLYPRFPPGSSVFLLNVPDVIGHAWLYGWALDAAIREFGYGELSREDPYLAARRRWQAQEAGQLPSPDSFFCYYFRELNLPMIQGLPVDKIYFFEYMPPPQWEGGRIGGAKIFEVGQLRERKDLKAQLLREGVLEG